MVRFLPSIAALLVIACIALTAHAAMDLDECPRYYRCTNFNYIFALGSTGECECCPKDATSGAECVAPEGICYLRPPNCATCGANNECLECNDGYEVISGNCEPIPCTVELCALCDPSEECYQCKGGYRLKDNVCIPANYTQEECQGMFTCPADKPNHRESMGVCHCCGTDGICDHAEPKCPQHPDNCGACNDEGMCTRCSPGFQLSDGHCVPLTCNVEFCAFCYPSDECYQCMGGYRLKDNTCIPANYTQEECEGLFWCPADTKFDMSLGMCQCCGPDNTCDHAEPKCPKHPDNCGACNDHGTCTACNPGFQLNEGSCDPVPSSCEVENCQECGADPQTCKTCESNYTLDPTTKQCVPTCTTENCQECEAGSATMCIRCEPGYFVLQPNGTCLRVCFPEFCQECEEGSTTVCKTCEAGYTWNGTECVPICVTRNCQECEAGSATMCIRCEPGYFVLQPNGTCIRVCFPEFCQECEEGSTTVCKTCEAGYTWTGTECVPTCTTDNCQECEAGSATMCKRCEPGYYVWMPNGTCIRVCFPEFCQECEEGSTTVCKTCEPGYTWTGTECVESS